MTNTYVIPEDGEKDVRQCGFESRLGSYIFLVVTIVHNLVKNQGMMKIHLYRHYRHSHHHKFQPHPLAICLLCLLLTEESSLHVFRNAEDR